MREVVTEIPNLPCSYTSEQCKKLDFTNKELQNTNIFK